MAQAGALCVALNTVVDFTNNSRLALVPQLLDGAYNANQMSHELLRLRLKGLVNRAEYTNTHARRQAGIRFAVTDAKLASHVLPRLLAADYPPAPTELRQACRVIDNHVHQYLDYAHIRIAA